MILILFNSHFLPNLAWISATVESVRPWKLFQKNDLLLDDTDDCLLHGKSKGRAITRMIDDQTEIVQRQKAHSFFVTSMRKSRKEDRMKEESWTCFQSQFRLKKNLIEENIWNDKNSNNLSFSPCQDRTRWYLHLWRIRKRIRKGIQRLQQKAYLSWQRNSSSRLSHKSYRGQGVRLAFLDVPSGQVDRLE